VTGYGVEIIIVIMRSHVAWILCIFAAIVHIGCGGPGERIKERAEAEARATPTATPGELAIGGSYAVEGTDPKSGAGYTGTLAVEPSGDLYSLRWTLAGGNRVGTGVQYGSSLAASFAATGAGKGCGVGLYKIAADGTLDGRIARLGDTQFAIEKATRAEGDSFAGKYTLTGTTADGKPYSGTLETRKDGEGYDFIWKTDKPFGGFGIWRGTTAAVSFGGPQCSFAYFDILSSSNLEGFWGGQKQINFGKESAKR
jgi:hypothetical protein